jgi:ATP-dependent Clp protease ATP-binding subunit ClpC
MLFRRPPKVPPPRPPDLPFDEASRDALGGATDQAREARATQVHAEHLLFALLAAEGSVARRAVARLGLAPEELRERVEASAPPRPWGLAAPVLPIADDLKGAIEFAMRETRSAGRAEVGTGQLLLGVLQSPTGVPFRSLGPPVIGLDALRSAVRVEDRLEGEGAEEGSGER